MRVVNERRVPRRAARHLGVVRRHLLDDAHLLAVRHVELEVAPVGDLDGAHLVAARLGAGALGGLHGGVVEVGGEGPQHVLLRIEVGVEAAVRHARVLDDVGDPGVEVAHLPEHLAGRVDEDVARSSRPGRCGAPAAPGRSRALPEPPSRPSSDASLRVAAGRTPAKGRESPSRGGAVSAAPPRPVQPSAHTWLQYVMPGAAPSPSDPSGSLHPATPRTSSPWAMNVRSLPTQ